MTSHAAPAQTSASIHPIAAMIQAAGRGERMRPLTDSTPKPLLTVQGKALMQWHLEALARGGFGRVVVNTAWLGEQIAATFGDVFTPQPPQNGPEQLANEEQSTTPVRIRYSHEGRDFGAALETAGGVVRALPLLCPAPAGNTSGDALGPSSSSNPNSSGTQDLAELSCVPAADAVFWVLAGDVFAPDFVFRQADVERFVASGKLAHLWLVPNPAHHRQGDFGLAMDPDDACGVGQPLNLPDADPQPRFTYASIGLYRTALFAPPWCDIPLGNPEGARAPLGPLLRLAMAQGLVSAELYTGPWTDVGTPQRLAQLNARRDME